MLDADQTLRFPDFRAEERTFALITQLAGRVGRGADSGASRRVLVQTLAPDAESLAFAARHDSDGFLAAELTRRKLLGYPPHGSLIRIVCSGPEASEGPATRPRLANGAAEALALATRLHALIAPSGATVLGPAPLFRLRGRSRSQLVIKSTDRPGHGARGRHRGRRDRRRRRAARGQRERRRRPAVSPESGPRSHGVLLDALS